LNTETKNVETSVPKCFEILPKFSIYQNFCELSCTPCTPSSYTTGRDAWKERRYEAC